MTGGGGRGGAGLDDSKNMAFFKFSCPCINLKLRKQIIKKAKVREVARFLKYREVSCLFRIKDVERFYLIPLIKK
jgi:hypothetical protein